MISITATPDSGSTVQDCLWHTVTSDKTGEVGFQYVFDIWINGEQKVRVKKYPEPTTLLGYFDAGEIIRNYMSSEWFVFPEEGGAMTPNDSGEASITYDVRYGEDYSGTTYVNLASGSTKAYNWVPPLYRRRVADILDRYNSYCTNRPMYADVSLNAGACFIPVFAGYVVKLTIQTYDSSNALIQSVTTNVNPTYEFAILNLSPAAINLAFSPSVIIDESVKYYNVLIDGIDIDWGIVYRFNVVCEGQYPERCLHFMNKWGMFDTARFDKAQRLSMDVMRKGFKQRDYTFGVSGPDYFRGEENVYRESKINHSIIADYQMKLTMNAPTDAEYTWLAELITSPQIYMEVDGYFYPVTLKDTNYEFSTQQNNRIKPLEVTVEMNQSRRSQLR